MKLPDCARPLVAGLLAWCVAIPARAMDVPVRVPEPDTLALVALAAAVGVLVWRGRRGKK
jgi:hypothetical protein